MAERFPSPIMVEEHRASLESISSEPWDETPVQPLMVDHSWLALYKEEKLKGMVDFVVDFVSSPQKDTEQTTAFLSFTWALCKSAKVLGLTQGMEIFCHGCNLAENIKVVLEEEPLFELRTEVRRLSMLAIAKMSAVGTVLEGKEKSLLEACFSSVFWLPPKEKIRDLSHCLYFRTLKGVDTVLEALVLNCPASRVSKLLQNIFELLINFSNCERPEVRQRVVGRIRILSRLLTSVNAAKNKESRDFQVPNLGRLLGQLVLLLSFKEEGDDTSAIALDALYSFFVQKHQKLTTLPKGRKKLRKNWEARTAALSCSETARNVTEILAKHLQPSERADFILKMFAKYLRPSERTDFILRIIEGMKDFSIYDKQLVGSVVAGIRGESSHWLVDMPKIMSSLYKTLHFISWDSAWQGVRSLLLGMLERCPEEAVRLLLDTAPPGDSSVLEMWGMMLSTPLAVDMVLVLLFKELQQRKQKMLFCTLTEDTSCLALLASIYLPGEHFARTYEFWRFLRHQSQAVLSVALSGVAALSRFPEMARKMKVLLPDLLEVLEQGNEDVQLKALRVCRNVLRELRREEATPMAVELLDKLLPLFDNELLSELREISISLFTELLKKVAGKCKRQMKQRVRRGLLPLFFHMSDETRSVAEASSQALLAAAELLRWQQLRDLVQTGQTWRIGECLLLQDRTRAEDYLEQSQGYLNNAQDTLRMEAIRFMGLAARGQSQQKLSEIMSALYPLEHDCTPSIQCLATQTVSILSSLRVKAEQRRTRRRWCC